MKIRALYILCLCSIHLVSSQRPFPAGVLDPWLWLSVAEDSLVSDRLLLRENISGDTLSSFSRSEARMLNGHWLFQLPEFTRELVSESQGGLSLFIVHRDSAPLEESLLWRLSSGVVPYLAGTTHRLASIKSGHYRRYPRALEDTSFKIHYYQNQTRGVSSASSPIQFRLGGDDAMLPLRGFRGELAEVIVYPRVLSPMEKQQVSSYLGIKYGISLSQLEYKHYYNSLGEKIWDAREHRGFWEHITAVGYDKLGNLQQLSGQQANEIPVVSMNIRSLENTTLLGKPYFVFWSDNGGRLSFSKQGEGQPLGLERRWVLDNPNAPDFQLNWHFNPEAVSFHSEAEIRELSRPLYYWLVVDTSGHSTYALDSTQYVRLQPVKSKVLSSFGGWSRFKSPRVGYSLWAAPEMFAHLALTQGKCHSSVSSSGQVAFNIVGGERPYDVMLQSLEHPNLQYRWQGSNENGSFKQALKSGPYRYRVTDARHRVYEQEFYLSDSDAPKLELDSSYELSNGEAILLDLSSQLKGENQYEWYYQGRLISTDSVVLLDQLGNYQVRVRNDQGCHRQVTFNISGVERPNSSRVLVYPNPSSDGYYQVSAHFPKQTSGQLTIYTLSGRELHREFFSSRLAYHYRGYLGHTGVYLVELQTALGRWNYKLIIK